jgi:hypothetical protein
MCEKKESKSDEITGFGDCLTPGKYKIHSTFSKVLNYVKGERLISIVTPEVGNGPVNIVFQTLHWSPQSCIEFAGKFLRINGFCYQLAEEKRYNSKIVFSTVDERVIEKSVSFFEKIVKQESPKKSYAFILDERREKYFTSFYDKALFHRVMNGRNELIKENYLEAVRLLKGTGYGFTPSGDDFIAGLITGYHILQKIYRKPIMEDLKVMYEVSKTGNIVSDNFLLFAYRGFFFEKIKNLLLSLLEGGGIAIKENTLTVLDMGETSGADYCTGLIYGLKNLTP